MMGFLQVVSNEEKLAQSEKSRYRSYLLADELRQSSDDLTRMARSYVNTSDARYKKYFKSILDIRDGTAPLPNDYHGIYWDFFVTSNRSPYSLGPAVSLKERMLNAGFTEKEFALLRESEFQSNSLAELETRAMNAVEGKFYDSATGQYSVLAKPDPDLARRLLYSSNYYEAKERVMRPVKRVFDSVDRRTSGQLQKHWQIKQRLNVFLMTTLGLAFLLLVLSMFIVAGFFKDTASADEAKLVKALKWSKILGVDALKNWHLIVASCVALFLIVGSSWWFYGNIKQSAKDSIARNLNLKLQASHEDIASWIESYKMRAHFLGGLIEEHISAKDLRVAKNGVSRGVERALGLSGVRASDLLQNFAVLDSNWEVVLGSDSSLVGRRLDPPLSVVEQMQHYPHVALRFPGKGSFELIDKSILLSVRLKQGIGAVFFFISPRDMLTPILGKFFDGRTGELYITNADGGLVTESRWRDALLSTLHPELSPSEVDFLSTVGTKLRRDVFDPRSDLVHAVQNAVLGMDNFKPALYQNYMGKKVLGTWLWDNENQYALVSEVGEEEALQFFSAYEKQSILGGSLASALILILTILAIYKRAELESLNEVLVKNHDTIKKQHEKMSRDLRIGQEVQMNMLPAGIKGENFEIDAMLKPAQVVSGDFYDFARVQGQEHLLYFSVGDVSGKGIPAALFMAVTKAFLRKSLERTNDTKEMVQVVNRELSHKNDRCMFVTLVVGILDTRTGQLQMTNAGHNPPYIKKSTGSVKELEGTQGPLVGAFEEAPFASHSLQMEPQDCLLLFTDGVTEAQNLSGAFYEEPRLEACLRSSGSLDPRRLVDHITGDVQQFIGEAEQFDDITLVALNYGDSKRASASAAH